jgi:hypothetical protein
MPQDRECTLLERKVHRRFTGKAAYRPTYLRLDSTQLEFLDMYTEPKTQLNSTGNLMASSVQFSSVESLEMNWIYDDLRRPPTARDRPQVCLNMFRIYRQS